VAAAVSLHEDQREVRALAFVLRRDGDDVLVVLGADFQLDRGPTVVLAGELLRVFLVVILAEVHVDVSRILMAVGRVALEDRAVFLKLVSIERSDLLRRIVRQELDGHHLHTEKAGGDVYVRALLFSFLPGVLLPCSGVDGEPSIPRVGVFIYVDSAEGCFDVNLLVLAVVAFLDVNLAGRQGDKDSKREYQNQCAITAPKLLHVTLPLASGRAARCRRRARQHSECRRADGRVSESPQTRPSLRSLPKPSHSKRYKGNSGSPENLPPRKDSPWPPPPSCFRRVPRAG